MSKDPARMPSKVIDHQSSNDAEFVEDLALHVQSANQRNSLRSKLSRAANIVRYYRTSQLLRRAVRRTVPSIFAHPLSALAVPALPPEETYRVRESARERIRSLAATRSVRSAVSMQTLGDDLSHGTFTLLQQRCELETPIDWHGHVASHPSHLWSFQLHYQEYLLDLAIDSTAAGTKTHAPKESNTWPVIWRIVADWIHGNPLESAQLSDDAWHPYCISRRLPVWAQLFALCEPPEDLRDKFLQSFACQAEVLSKTLEFDLGGNHLLENLSAMALAGAFLEGSLSESWLDLAMVHLCKELPLQVLPHGEHYERAPMYHCQVLGNLLQVAFATTDVREDLADLCRETALKMFEFLESILHPDGEIPLFGDSCWGESHSVNDIRALADLNGLDVGGDKFTETSLPATIVGPYWVWRQAEDAIIFDTGPVGASTLPAHAHCDLQGFEASIAGQRWFVDSGLFDYNEGLMRDYCRSSAAHNVVTVGHQNCCDVWSRFRMGRRGRPTRFEHGRQGDFSWCQASHDGYRHLDAPELSRLMVMHTSGVWTCLEHAIGKTASSLIGRLHLAPGMELRQLSPHRLLLTKDGIERWLSVTTSVELGLVEGWYCDRFGRRARTQVITYRLKDPSSTGYTFGWSLLPSAKTAAEITIEDDATGRVEIAIGGSSEIFRRQFSH